MNKQEAISEACSIVSLAYNSIGDFEHCSDCFCTEATDGSTGFGYQNDGFAIDYVRKAVLNQLKADRYKISQEYNPETGRELTDTKQDGVR